MWPELAPYAKGVFWAGIVYFVGILMWVVIKNIRNRDYQSKGPKEEI